MFAERDLEAAPIGGQLFAHDNSRRDCAAISPLLDTYATRLLAQALRGTSENAVKAKFAERPFHALCCISPRSMCRVAQTASLVGERRPVQGAVRLVGSFRGYLEAAVATGAGGAATSG
jgi:hypothetical protein